MAAPREAVIRKLTLIVFPGEMGALLGYHALEQLHREGSVFVFGAAVVERADDGTISVRKRTSEVPLGARLGALVGSLRNELPADVAPDLAPGSFAVFAETGESWGTPWHARMTAAGGSVVCEWWNDVGDDALEQRTLRAAALAAPRGRS